jgi:ACR3 family arsenite efflux pump ArsB
MKNALLLVGVGYWVLWKTRRFLFAAFILLSAAFIWWCIADSESLYSIAKIAGAVTLYLIVPLFIGFATCYIDIHD